MVASPESDDFFNINPINILDTKAFVTTHDNKKFVAVHIIYPKDMAQDIVGIPDDQAEKFVIDTLKILAGRGSEKAKRALSFLDGI